VRAAVVLLLSAALAAGAGACGDDNSRVPEGEPVAVVAAAADKTAAAGTVSFSATTVDAVVEGTVDLRAGTGTAAVQGPRLGERRTGVEVDYSAAYLTDADAVAGFPELPPQLVKGGPQPGNPIVVLDLLRGVTESIPYGGSLIRGHPAFRYEVILDPSIAADRAPVDRRDVLRRLRTPLEGDVWVDQEGRARRLQVGNDLTVRTTTTDRRGAPVATTIDLYGFEGDE
jgi:hypothetical protein